MRKATLVKDLVETLARIPEAIKRATFVQECAHLMKIDEHILVRETNKAVSEFIKQKRDGISRDEANYENRTQKKLIDQQRGPDEKTFYTLPDPRRYRREFRYSRP